MERYGLEIGTRCNHCGQAIPFGHVQALETLQDGSFRNYHLQCASIKHSQGKKERAKLTQQERATLIEWLTVFTRKKREYWEKQDDGRIEREYEKAVASNAES